MLPIFLAVALFSIGCSQNKSYQPPAERQPISYEERRPVSSGKYRAVALADLDNDGNLDVVAGGSSPPTLAISYGDGRGGMSSPEFLSSKGDVQSLAIADFNEDGLMDIVISAQRGTAGIKIWQNRSRQKWIKTAGPIEINNYQGLASGDVNGDGHFDIVAANASSDTQGGIQVWLGDGNGNWPAETGPTITGKYMDVALADFNEDGILDLAAAGWGIYGALRIWLGNGSGNWSATPPLSNGSNYGVSVGDLNRDGHMDILAATYRAGVHIFLGDGTGAFVKTMSPQQEGSFWDIVPVDLDGDGVLDLVASSLDSNGIKAWRNEGPGSWAEIQGRFPSFGSYYGLALADLNQDGYDDICAASLGEGVKIWKGSGSSGLGHSTPKRKPLSSPEEKAVIETIEENAVYTTTSGFPEYKVGPGDILEITLWQGTTAKREEVLIRPDGKVSFGFVEDLYVKGLTTTQLDDLLTRLFKEYVKQPRLDVVVKEFNSKSVTLTGAVGRRTKAGGVASGAGEYPLQGKVSLLELVSKAGGPTPDANLREVRVRRQDGQSISLDLNKAIFQGDPSQNVILDAGDLVFIPTLDQEANRVYVFGEVKEPGLYTFTRSDMRLFDAISKAGGPTVFATEESTKIVRGDVTHPEILSVDLKQLIEQGDQTQNILLASGDLVYVPRRFWGDVNIFWQRIKPLFELVFSPANIINEYDEALDALSGE
ncbi:MAG: VCBS repeat-containing protein [Deltaproteobacteria bacterium]|nr:MAG: VCBS repeat-containing protein [Deltaproteobacteria bacterium]